MNKLLGFFTRLQRAFNRRGFESDMAEEMRHHVEAETARRIATGESPATARRRAAAEFGSIDALTEEVRDNRIGACVESIWRDVVYGGRSLRKHPGFTATAVLTLALGVGVNTALFTLFDAIALQTLPARDATQLVDILANNPQVNGRREVRWSYPDYFDFHAAQQTFVDIAAVSPEKMRLTDSAGTGTSSPLEVGAGLVNVAAVSGNYFATLGTEVSQGRNFLPEEVSDTARRPVIVLSDLFWQRHLAADPNVLGQTIAFQSPQGKRTEFQIIGVTTPNFVGQTPVPPAGWVPLTSIHAGLENRSLRSLFLIGRLRPDVTRDRAKADLDLITQRLTQSYPEENRPNSVLLPSAMRIFNPGFSPQLAVVLSPLLLGFGLVLLIACLNVANLLLARGAARQQEIGVRLTLGAGRGHILRQLLVENALLCLVGSTLGMLFAVWTLQGIRPLVVAFLDSQQLARSIVELIPIGLNARIMIFAGGLSLAACLTAGFVPAWCASRHNLAGLLRNEGSVFGRQINPTRLRNLLVIGQVAVCLTILVVAGLMTGNLIQISDRDPGFDPSRVFETTYSPTTAPEGVAAPVGDLRSMIERLRTLRGVTSAAAVERVPLQTPGTNHASVRVQNPDNGIATPAVSVAYNRITGGFFETFGISLLTGRTFSPLEVQTSAPVVVLSEAAARSLWPGQNALGRSLAVNAAIFPPSGSAPSPAPDDKTYLYREVIGVVRDIRSNWVGDDYANLVYFPLPAAPTHGRFFVRLEHDSVGELNSLVERAAAAGVPLQLRERLTAIINRSVMPYQALAWLSEALAGLALLLATIGLYGVTSFAVSLRVREIGIRMALGATARKVIALFVRQSMRLVAVGMIIGAFGAVGFTILVTKILPTGAIVAEPVFRIAVFSSVMLILAGLTLFAGWLPARRATRVDPMVALRAE